MDIMEKIGKSTIHHGKDSNRIYLMSLDRNDLSNITQKLDDLAHKNGYTKIMVKVQDNQKQVFEENGYETEAVIPTLYSGKSGRFLCKYLDEQRRDNRWKATCSEILKIAREKKPDSSLIQLSDGFVCREAKEDDILSMVEVYKSVFESYPFPIYDEGYILKTMKENLVYFGIWKENQLVALSSIELAKKHSNAEMTDFAVLKEYRGSRLARCLLRVMEEKLLELSVQTAYTIARAKSPGMNITFAKNGYTYSGTLVNNTQIAGQIESMNVWYKSVF